MDPQSLSFTPQSPDLWQLTTTMRSFQETQQDHDARLRTLERRQDEDTRVKSVWGGNSPFPSGLTGTPQLGTAAHPSGVDFANFDDDNSANMMRSLQLEADDPPRRLGATSRANSVRFDESANQNQWSHNNRASGEFITRSSSGLGGLGGGLPMFERSASHKSEGRQSSTGHSISGRANSIGLDTSALMQGSTDEAPGIAPSLFLLGSVPAIIRCWMKTDYTHDSLLYAAVCTGSYRSFLDERIIHELGYDSVIRSDIRGTRRIKLPLYLPEAVPLTMSSRSSSVSHQPSCPSIVVDFNVLEAAGDLPSPKAIQIFLGSDMLRANNADILFSSNLMTMFDSNRNKLSVPFVRPEDEQAFKGLYITTTSRQALDGRASLKNAESMVDLGNMTNGSRPRPDPITRSSSLESEHTEALEGPSTAHMDGPSPPRDASVGSSNERRSINSSRPSLTMLNTFANNAPEQESPHSGPTSRTSNTQSSATPTTAPATAIWSNWRRDGSQPPPGSLSGLGTGSTTTTTTTGEWGARRKEAGIKVLKPTRQGSRSVSTAASSAAPTASALPAATSPTAGQSSRFFDEVGKRRGTSTTGAAAPSTSGSVSDAGEAKSVVSASGSKTLPRGAGNPIGGASAFGWLNSGGK